MSPPRPDRAGLRVFLVISGAVVAGALIAVGIAVAGELNPDRDKAQWCALWAGGGSYTAPYGEVNPTDAQVAADRQQCMQSRDWRHWNGGDYNTLAPAK